MPKSVLGSSLSGSLVLCIGDNSVDILNSLINISAVINAHIKNDVAVVLDDSECVGHDAAGILALLECNFLVNDLRAVDIDKSVMTHDLLIEKVVGKGEVLAVNVHLILREVDHGGVIDVGTVLVVSALLEVEPFGGVIVISLDRHGIYDLAEVRFIDLKALLSSLIEELYSLVDLIIEVGGRGSAADHGVH